MKLIDDLTSIETFLVTIAIRDRINTTEQIRLLKTLKDDIRNRDAAWADYADAFAAGRDVDKAI